MKRNYEELIKNNDYDPDLMETKEAELLINYMNDFIPEQSYNLKAHNYFFVFLFPYVVHLMEEIEEKIKFGFQKGEARSESMKEVCFLIDNVLMEMNS